mgnify:FL=1
MKLGRRGLSRVLLLPCAERHPLLLQLDKIEYWLEQERERLPLWIPVGLGVGVAIWELYWSSALWPLTFACLVCLMASLLAPAASRLKSLIVLAALCLAAGYGSIALKSWNSEHQVLKKVWVGEFFGRIESVENLAARQKYRLVLQTDGHAGLPRRLRVNLRPAQFKDDMRVGAIVGLKARLMPPAGPALPGGYDFSRRAWFAELGATGTALGDVKIHTPSRASPWLSKIRATLALHIRGQLPDGEGSIAAALATGDTGAISDENATAMRESGMAHLLSISGLHVTAVVGAIFLMTSRILSLSGWFALRFPVPIYAASLAALGAIGYTLLTGAEVPTIRSCVAALLILVALILGREVLSLRMVAAGAIFVLIFWPESLAGPSFQLSFAAVTTIILLHEQPFMRRLISAPETPLVTRLLRGILSLLLTGLAIELVLSPIALFHFHKTGLYGALANLVAIPLTTFVIMPFEALALLFDSVGLGAPFWWVVRQGLAVILALAHNVSSLPGAVTMRPEMPIIAFGSIIIGGLWFTIFITRKRLLGLLPLSAGLIGMLTAPTPDLLITGDGKNLALTDDRGNIALLRAGVGDYVRDTLKEAAGTKSEPIPIASWRGTSCSPDICIVRIKAAERHWDILATRTPNQIPSMELAAACRRVDIVISDRYLPYSCKPRWQKFDRKKLQQTGGIAIHFGKARAETVAARISGAPWYKKPDSRY